MKKIANWIMIAGLLGIITTGCGTSQNAEEPQNGSAPSQNEEQADQNNQNTENPADETADDASENNDQNAEEAKDNETRGSEQSIQYQLNGETKEATATLQTSDNLHYSMYVLPEFELTAEEPNQDVVYLTEDGNTFMRIQYLSPDTDWKMAEETMKTQLASLNEEVETIQVPDDEFFKDCTAMKASKNGEIMTGYLIKNAKQPMQLTIFTNEEADYSDAFVQMGKTIIAD